MSLFRREFRYRSAEGKGTLKMADTLSLPSSVKSGSGPEEVEMCDSPVKSALLAHMEKWYPSAARIETGCSASARAVQETQERAEDGKVL